LSTGDRDGLKTCVFERILQVDRWTNQLRYPPAKRENFATGLADDSPQRQGEEIFATDENQIHTDKEISNASWKLEFTCRMLCSLGSMSGKVEGSPFGARNFSCPGAVVWSMPENARLCPVFEEFLAGSSS
jgi:hypothetical protein